MKKQLVITLLILTLITTDMVEGTKKTYGVYDNNNSVKLFVFGDSYVDTGNFLNSSSYKPPYGITFPGKPAGRFSDGRVLTDYIASFLKIESPTPYSLKNSSNLQYGINFAHGGTGVFQTSINGPNMTVQIDSLEKLIKQNVYTKQDLKSSIALVSASGNDYVAFVSNRSITEIKSFTTLLIKQLSLNVQRIHNLGINKIAIGLLEPIGCMPPITQQLGKSVFVPLDLYNAFLSTIEMMQKNRYENSALMNPLELCCKGESLENSCGSVDDNGEKKYSLCEKPEVSFFWDTVHPSQNGWNAVYKQLQSSLGQLIEKN
ncbi:unnamed protein product [Lathyrus sativus]|nr:unnamed protein product [Lathyrus sativus]